MPEAPAELVSVEPVIVHYDEERKIRILPPPPAAKRRAGEGVALGEARIVQNHRSAETSSVGAKRLNRQHLTSILPAQVALSN